MSRSKLTQQEIQEHCEYQLRIIEKLKEENRQLRELLK